MLLAWPSAFFLVATYPESVTLAVVTLSFLAARRGHFVAAGLLAAAAVAGKSYLVVLLVALAMEVWTAPRDRASWRAGRDLEWLSPPRSPPAAWWPSRRRRSPSSWRGSPTSGPVSTSGSPSLGRRRSGTGTWAARGPPSGGPSSDLVHLRLLDTSTESIVELFDLVTVILLAVAAVIAYVRIRHSYGVLLGLAWCVFTFQTILQSQSRDVLVLFPFFAALACGWPGTSGASVPCCSCSCRAAISCSNGS